MKKIVLLILTGILLIAGCGQVDDVFYPRPTGDTEDPGTDPGTDPNNPDQTYWVNAADSATDRLLSAFWNNSNNCFYQAFTPPSTQGSSWAGYWPQAHAMDVVIDAYIRTGDTKYSAYYPKWFTGVKARNGATWKNNYIDDMEWIALAMLRMYETTQNAEYLTTARQIYDDWIITQWSETPGGGGILWCTTTTPPSKNACSNGPAGVIAGRLANLVTDPVAKDKYKADAVRIFTWLKAVLIQANGAVYDNISGANPQGTTLTYNSGTCLGTAHELYKLTGTQSYLDDAIRLANFCITPTSPTMNSTSGCLRDEGTGDGGLFKGIFIRYFVKLINDTHVDKATRQKFYNFMVHNATTAWTTGMNKTGNYQSLFNTNWAVPRTQSGAANMQEQVAGCTLLEAMNVLQPVD
jgi:predicted alpha-1,6-mannanase (GH76 family)